MKKLIVMLIMLLVMPLTIWAGDCERYWNELVERSFEVTIDDTDYMLSGKK